MGGFDLSELLVGGFDLSGRKGSFFVFGFEKRVRFKWFFGWWKVQGILFLFFCFFVCFWLILVSFSYKSIFFFFFFLFSFPFSFLFFFF